MDETNESPPNIKVVDRRKFTADGEPVANTAPNAPPPAPKAAQPPSPPESSAPVEGFPPPSSEPSTPPVDASGDSRRLFLELLTMLAGQAELLMVGAEGLPPQPAEARRMIDYLAVLEEKTTGNLSAEESKALSSVIGSLKTLYIQRK